MCFDYSVFFIFDIKGKYTEIYKFLSSKYKIISKVLISPAVKTTFRSAECENRGNNFSKCAMKVYSGNGGKTPLLNPVTKEMQFVIFTLLLHCLEIRTVVSS